MMDAYAPGFLGGNLSVWYSPSKDHVEGSAAPARPISQQSGVMFGRISTSSGLFGKTNTSSGLFGKTNTGGKTPKNEPPEKFTVQNLASPVVSLHVGPDGVVLTAHKAILTRCVYFAKCLEKGCFEEGSSNTIKLPDEDPDGMAAVLRFLYTGNILASEKDDIQTIKQSQANDRQMPKLVKFYTAADRYCIQEMCDKIRSVVEDCPFLYLAWGDMAQLKAAGLRGSPLWEILTTRIVRSLREVDSKTDCSELLKDGLGTDHEMTRELVERMAAMVTKKKQEQ